MRTGLSTILALLAPLAVACGGDDGGSTVDAPSGSIDAPGSAVDAPTADAGPPVTVSGNVHFNDTMVEGATISIMGTAIETTSDAGGLWSMEVPQGSHFITATLSPYWGNLRRITVPSGGLTDVNMNLIEEGDVQDVADALGRTIDEGKGIVQITLHGGTGGEGGTITADADPAFVFDSNNNPVEQGTLIAGGNEEIIYSNATLGTTAAAVTDGDTHCVLRYPGVTTWPVQGKMLTTIEADCN